MSSVTSSTSVLAVVVMLIVCQCYCSAQCTPSPPNGLIIPPIITTPAFLFIRNLRPKVGVQSTDWWTVFSETQVREHGLWCQVLPADNMGMGNNIGDWYYPPDGSILVPTSDPSNTIPYQSLKCNNQIGLVVDGDMTNNQGIVRCSTTITGLYRKLNYFVVYSDSVFNNYNGPTIDTNMKFTLLSSRDSEVNLMFTLKFIVSNGPPSRLNCDYNGNAFLNEQQSRQNPPELSREVIRSHYINSSYPDMTRVTLTLTSPRQSRTYTCTVTVEGRVNINNTNYDFDPKGSGTSTVSITVAGTPTSVTATRNGYDCANVSWTAPSTGTPPAGYEVFYQLTGEDIVSGGNTINSELTLTGLTIGNYSIFVVGFGAEGDPVLPSARSETTLKLDIPQLSSTPTLVPDASSIMVSWSPTNLIPLSYRISYSCQLICGSSVTNQTVTVDGSVTTHTVSATPGSSCVIGITAVFSSNNSNTVTSSTNTTSTFPAGAPGGLTITSVESRSLSVVWGTVPCPHQRGPITGYRLRYIYSNGTSIVNTTGEGSRQHVLTGLTPLTTYSVQVAAVNDGGTGPYSTPLTVETLQDTNNPSPQVTPADPVPEGWDATGLAVGIGSVFAVLALIIVIVIVIVAVVVRHKKGKKEHSVHYVKEGPKVDTAYTNPQYSTVTEPQYTAVTNKPFINMLPKDTTVMEGTRVEFPVQVIGTPYPKLTWYHNSTHVANDYAHEISSNGTLTIVTVEMKHAGSYQLVATNSVGTTEEKFTLKVMSKTPDEAPSAGNDRVEVSHPVPMAEFGQYVSQNHNNSNKGFTTLYNILDSCEKDHAVTVAVSATNKPLNRFNNITVYDDNHIVLQSIKGRPECQREYINASYINGYSQERKFIACQGPLSKTLTDHWRMIWQERAHTIVMVTNIKEDKKVKCQQYWPEDDSKDFGPFRVTLTDQQMFANFTIRLLQVELLNGSEYPRLVTQYHFTSWPDHGVPEYGTPILAFHCRIKQDYKPSQGPMVVHCSAGVGRTGTFIAIDTILEQVKKEGIVDVSGVITTMRNQRMKMVQTVEQYIFIHDVVLESVTCGDTQINSGDMKSAIAKLKSRDPTTGKTHLQAQFEVLNQVTPNPNTGINCKDALMNETKNRSMEFLPSNKHRVILKRGHPDYIHASYVNSYRQKKVFIVTQNPMKSTSGDFWQMVVERECGVIVMLCSLQENGQEVCHQYWPSTDMSSHGEFSIKILGSNQCNGYVERSLSVIDKLGKIPHQVTQFQIQNWNSYGKCSSPQTIITVVEEMYKVQRRTDNKPVVVHCSDTVSRSGMFCAIATTIDRCKTESVVDVFQVVKAQRIQKPGLVLTVEQYQFVFEAVLTFLESFETYSNFK